DFNSTAVVTTADIDGNGTLDIVMARSDGSVSVLPGSGNGTFGGEEILGLVDGHTSMVVADADGDGKLDIVFGDANYDGNVTVLTRSNSGNYLGQSCAVIFTPPVVNIGADPIAPTTPNTVKLLISVTGGSSYQASFGLRYEFSWFEGNSVRNTEIPAAPFNTEY